MGGWLINLMVYGSGAVSHCVLGEYRNVLAGSRIALQGAKPLAYNGFSWR